MEGTSCACVLQVCGTHTVGVRLHLRVYEWFEGNGKCLNGKVATTPAAREKFRKGGPYPTGRWHALIDCYCYGQRRRPVARSNWPLRP